MADDTTFDLNDPYNLEDYYTEAQISSMSQKKQSEKLNSIWNNYCITDSYEPGSTAKPLQWRQLLRKENKQKINIYL